MGGSYYTDTLKERLVHCHTEQNDLIITILSQIAKKKRKSLEKIKRSLLIKQNKAINRQFWAILDSLLPSHGYHYIGCCGECGLFELREQLPTD